MCPSIRIWGHTAKAVIAEFGYDRVGFVLANTIQHKDWDGRFSRDNKAWAKEIFIVKEDRRNEYVVESHPAVLDGFVDQAKRAYKELNLWDKSQTNDPQSMDFEGKVMVLCPDVLNEQHKTRDEQLFYCVGGFGCSPGKIGRKVMGEFLTDGEQTHFYRQDFLGEAKAEMLPHWAVGKIALLKEQKAEKPSVKKQLEQAQAEKSVKPKSPAKNKDKELR